MNKKKLRDPFTVNHTAGLNVVVPVQNSWPCLSECHYTAGLDDVVPISVRPKLEFEKFVAMLV